MLSKPIHCLKTHIIYMLHIICLILPFQYGFRGGVLRILRFCQWNCPRYRRSSWRALRVGTILLVIHFWDGQFLKNFIVLGTLKYQFTWTIRTEDWSGVLYFLETKNLIQHQPQLRMLHQSDQNPDPFYFSLYSNGINIHSNRRSSWHLLSVTNH